MRMSSLALMCGWPGPSLNSRSVLAPALGPEVMDTSVCTHSAPLAGTTTGAEVSTAPTDGLPHAAVAVDRTWPGSVVTAPPDAFWYGRGVVKGFLLGPSPTA